MSKFKKYGMPKKKHNERETARELGFRSPADMEQSLGKPRHLSFPSVTNITQQPSESQKAFLIKIEAIKGETEKEGSRKHPIPLQAEQKQVVQQQPTTIQNIENTWNKGNPKITRQVLLVNNNLQRLQKGSIDPDIFVSNLLDCGIPANQIKTFFQQKKIPLPKYLQNK